MCIQNGAPATTLTIMNNNLKRITSIRFIFFLLFFLAGAAGAVSMSVGLYVSGKEDILDSSSRKLLLSYSGDLAERIGKEGFVDNPEEPIISHELRNLALLYDGRALVCDDSLRIVFDTAHEREGTYLISDAAVSAVRGHERSDVDEEGICVIGVPVIAEEGKPTAGALLYSFSEEKQMQQVSSLRNRIISFLVIFLVFLVGFGIFLSKRFSRPLMDISAAMLRLSATDRNDPIDVPVPYSEIREIRDNANRMITKLNSVDESRQAFVSNVSHELKTPMSSMKVLADSLLSQEHQSEEVYREFLSDINTEIDRENQIISDLLTLVKLEGKATSLKTEKVHINGLTEIVIKRILPLAEEQHVEVVVENQRDVYAEVDENSIIMALTNILENSVKYNKKNGSVRVTVNADWNNCFITIRDTGIGIPEESLSHLFEKFYRVDKARSRETGGSGLGLSIAYEIVKAHNGDIKVFSKLQKGTKFVITLPLVASKREVTS